MALAFASDHQMLRRLARRLGIVEPMAPMASVFHYRSASDASPNTRDEAYRLAVSHAENPWPTRGAAWLLRPQGRVGLLQQAGGPVDVGNGLP